jgi:nitroreductase
MIEALIAAAIQAPSAMNEQPWVFSVIQDSALLDRIAASAKAHMQAQAQAGAGGSHVGQMLSDPDFQIFYHAPALIVISTKGKGRWSVEDCALAAQNLMLAACAAGLGSCWIGFAQSWLQTEEGRAALLLSANDLPVAPIIVGHPKTVAAPVARKPADIRWVGP